MQQLQVNTFFSYELSQSEEEAGQVFTREQKMVLQNKLASIAQDKLNLTFDPANVNQFIQREAELQGQMGVINWLLDTSNQVEEAIAARHAETQESQNQ